MTTGSAKAFTVRGKVITKEHCKIYEGLVEFESGNTTRAICKVLSQSEDFDIHQREAALYSNQLFALQDKSVPRFLGCFRSDLDGTTVSCILLKTPGEVIMVPGKESFRDYSEMLR